MKGGARGDFYVVLEVHVPPDGNEATRAAVETLESSYTESPRAGLGL